MLYPGLDHNTFEAGSLLIVVSLESLTWTGVSGREYIQSFGVYTKARKPVNQLGNVRTTFKCTSTLSLNTSIEHHMKVT